MDKPTLRRPFCVFCGRPKNSEHHVIPRSQGGTDGPTLSVCGMGNESGCHGLLHSHRLHVAWDGEWVFLYTEEPTKYDKALTMDGWRPIRKVWRQ